jgi:hypothetical protein
VFATSAVRRSLGGAAVPLMHNESMEWRIWTMRTKVRRVKKEHPTTSTVVR